MKKCTAFYHSLPYYRAISKQILMDDYSHMDMKLFSKYPPRSVTRLNAFASFYEFSAHKLVIAFFLRELINLVHINLCKGKHT